MKLAGEMQMEQISMFSEDITFPTSYEDIDKLYEEYIFEGETDEDVFSSGDLTSYGVPYGKSYFFYGKKVFEFIPPSKRKSKLTIFRSDKSKLDLTSATSSKDLLAAFEELKGMKQEIFRNLNTESFGCCNDFIRCSDALQCLHEEDRFYNNCMYRKNLEAGRVFYGKNKNI